jgi:hypothetical protein
MYAEKPSSYFTVITILKEICNLAIHLILNFVAEKKAFVAKDQNKNIDFDILFLMIPKLEY